MSTINDCFTSTVISGINKLLIKIIEDRFSKKDPVTDEITKHIKVVLDSPGTIEEVTQNTLSLYLMQVTPNVSLRNSPNEIKSENPALGTRQEKYRPIAVDLLYLITPYASGLDLVETELGILENMAQFLYDNAIVDVETHGIEPYKTNLISSGNTKLHITAKELSLDELNKLWSMFPGKPYKASFAYLVSPVRIASTRRIDGSITKKRFVKARNGKDWKKTPENETEWTDHRRELPDPPVGSN